MLPSPPQALPRTLQPLPFPRTLHTIPDDPFTLSLEGANNLRVYTNANRLKNRTPNYNPSDPRNNSAALLGHKQIIVTATGDDVEKVKNYEDALGLTSISESLGILANTEDYTISKKAKAIGDLILLRLILSGRIIFRKETKILGIIQEKLSKDFKRIPNIEDKFASDNIIPKVKRLIDDLKDPEITKTGKIELFQGFLLLMASAFGVEFMASLLMTVVGERMMMGLGSIVFTHSFTILAPLIISLLAVVAITDKTIDDQNDIIVNAIVLMIDNFFITNDGIMDIINNEDAGSLVPSPISGDPVAMGLFFKYIKYIRDNHESTNINSDEPKMKMSNFLREITSPESSGPTMKMNNFLRGSSGTGGYRRRKIRKTKKGKASKKRTTRKY